MSKQTAVEWLGLELNIIFHDITPELWEEVELKFQQAKQMEKEQIIGAYDRDVIGGIQNWFIGNGEKYYNLHYMGNKEESNPKPDQNYTFEDGV
jgi:hypothetical protein